jgi:hypothetical protein
MRRSSGAAQRQALDQAVEYLSRAAASDALANPRARMEYGAALLLRARITQGDRSADLQAAQSAFRDALTAGAAADSNEAWWLQLTLRQIAQAQPADADLRRAQAREIIAGALGKSTDDSRKAVWQASAIQLAIDEVLSGPWGGAVKRIRLREIQAMHRSLLVPGAPPPLVFTWAKLLCEEGKELVGRARREKFAEAKRALELADTAADAREEIEMRLLGASIARQRGYAEDRDARLTLLFEAEKLLEPYLQHPDAAPLQMEAAMVALEQASLLRPAAAKTAAAKALSLAEPLLTMFELEEEALRCHLKASLMLDSRGGAEPQHIEGSRVDRLIELAPADAQTWLLAARHAVARGDYRQATAHCEAALRLGASEAALNLLWVQISAAPETADALPAIANARKRLLPPVEPVAAISNLSPLPDPVTTRVG